MKLLLKILSFIGIFLLTTAITLYLSLLIICYGPSKKARNMFVTTFLETGALKFVVGLVMPDSKVQQIVDSNSLKAMETDMDASLIEVADTTDEIEIKEISGSNYYATLMIVHDPSRVKVGSTYPFTEEGQELDKIVDKFNAIAGINGGLYVSTGNKGGYPLGMVISEGEILYNAKYGVGYHLIGFDNNNVLRIVSMEGKTPEEMATFIQDEGIRDAVTFQEEASDANNHFVKLIINGKTREANGLGSGANPRTAIGQREDGAVLLLVTDGRGSNGHLGATAGDLIDIMKEYGAVNAANIDGGSSSCMYYNGEYLMTSVTFYYSNSSWKLPDAFIVTK